MVITLPRLYTVDPSSSNTALVLKTAELYCRIFSWILIPSLKNKGVDNQIATIDQLGS